MTGHLRLRATWIGQSVPTDLRGASVLGHFSKGAYIRAGGSVLAIGAIPAGPLHVALRSWPPGKGEGSPVEVDVSRAKVWRPAALDLLQLRQAARTIAALPDLAIAPAELKSVWADTKAAVDAGDLFAVGRCLQGRGSGLTPTGDDVFAGLLLIDAFRDQPPARESQRLGLADTAQTSDLSRAFLHWASKGQSIEPVHRFLQNAAVGDVLSTRAAAGQVAGIGSTSGQAILSGIALGLAVLDRSEQGEPTLGGKAFTQVSR